MEKGISLSTKSIIKSFDEETKLEIKKMQEEIKNYSLQVPNFNDNITNLSLTEEQIYALKGYTGLNFKKINSLLRKIWNYEELGIKLITFDLRTLVIMCVNTIWDKEKVDFDKLLEECKKQEIIKTNRDGDE